MSDRKKPIYKIIFHNQGRIFEVYAANVSHDSLIGFVEVEKLIFGETSSVVVDPTEEKLKAEFSGVERTYIPMHSIIRIDQVSKKGQAKITEGDTDGKIMPFPMYSNNSEPSNK